MSPSKLDVRDESRRKPGCHKCILRCSTLRKRQLLLSNSSRFLACRFRRDYMLTLSSVQQQSTDVNRPVFIGVLFYLTCQRSHVRIDRKKLMALTKTPVREWDHVCILVQTHCKSLLPNNNSNEQGRLSTSLPSSPAKRSGLHEDILQQLNDQFYATIENMPRKDRQQEGIVVNRPFSTNLPDATAKREMVCLQRPVIAMSNFIETWDPRHAHIERLRTTTSLSLPTSPSRPPTIRTRLLRPLEEVEESKGKRQSRFDDFDVWKASLLETIRRKTEGDL
jgi:hypothetical protein